MSKSDSFTNFQILFSKRLVPQFHYKKKISRYDYSCRLPSWKVWNTKVGPDPRKRCSKRLFVCSHAELRKGFPYTNPSLFVFVTTHWRIRCQLVVKSSNYPISNIYETGIIANLIDTNCAPNSSPMFLFISNAVAHQISPPLCTSL